MQSASNIADNVANVDGAAAADEWQLLSPVYVRVYIYHAYVLHVYWYLYFR